MTINPVTGTPDVQRLNEKEGISRRIESKPFLEDKVEISSQAKVAHQLRLYADRMAKKVLADIPDARGEIVAQAAVKLKAGEYNQQEITGAIAQRLMRIMGLGV
jgi:hypothetical protein